MTVSWTKTNAGNSSRRRWCSLTSELFSNHQKKVRVLVWLGQTTAVRLAAFSLLATIGAERYTRSTGPEAVAKHMQISIRLIEVVNTEYWIHHRWCTLQLKVCAFARSPSLICIKVLGVWLTWYLPVSKCDYLEKRGGFMLYALLQGWVMTLLIHVLVMCKKSALLSDPRLFSAVAITR